jgi:MerR family transcriptional regulator/heat shock protein HspR
VAPGSGDFHWRDRANVRDGYGRDPRRPVYVISVAAGIVSVHPRTLRIYEEEGLVCPARTPTNIRLYSEEDIRRVLWIRHLTQNLGVNLAGIRILFAIEERLGSRILETLLAEPDSTPTDGPAQADRSAQAADPAGGPSHHEAAGPEGGPSRRTEPPAEPRTEPRKEPAASRRAAPAVTPSRRA